MENQYPFFNRCILGVRLICYVAGLLLILGLLDFVLTATAIMSREAAKVDKLIDTAQIVADRTEQHINDDFMRNVKNYLYTSIDASQITINTSTRLVDRAVVFLDRLDERTGKTMDRVDLNLDRLYGDTFPALTRVLNSADKSIQDTDKVLLAIKKKLDDPNIAKLIEGLAATSQEAAAVLKELKVTEQEINKELPEILSNLNKLTDNHAQLAGEMATFIKSINAPTSRKMKVWRAIIQILAVGLPVAVRR